ncbi:hypothetical protein A1O1_04609 [Capronia coronata CBS 617.96]|uniref:Uncharacterized protein n=1 Tax=Capronia coronata CBS 617.96 TaxID=1182541 RepID=W9YDC9_9EURO|nr:uncharacterized protein A1O1_04609 [Capronia coronata CBS 617.96]EXJ87685.1 hypothetical protein A1O1_04609 [Capronia coronata CBS 617.96]
MAFLRLIPDEHLPSKVNSAIPESSTKGCEPSSKPVSANTQAKSGSSDCKFLKLTPDPRQPSKHQSTPGGSDMVTSRAT